MRHHKTKTPPQYRYLIVKTDTISGATAVVCCFFSTIEETTRYLTVHGIRPATVTIQKVAVMQPD